MSYRGEQPVRPRFYPPSGRPVVSRPSFQQVTPPVYLAAQPRHASAGSSQRFAGAGWTAGRPAVQSAGRQSQPLSLYVPPPAPLPANTVYLERKTVKAVAKLQRSLVLAKTSVPERPRSAGEPTALLDFVNSSFEHFCKAKNDPLARGFWQLRRDIVEKRLDRVECVQRIACLVGDNEPDLLKRAGQFLPPGYQVQINPETRQPLVFQSASSQTPSMPRPKSVSPQPQRRFSDGDVASGSLPPAPPSLVPTPPPAPAPTQLSLQKSSFDKPDSSPTETSLNKSPSSNQVQSEPASTADSQQTPSTTSPDAEPSVVSHDDTPEIGLEVTEETTTTNPPTTAAPATGAPTTGTATTAAAVKLTISTEDDNDDDNDNQSTASRQSKSPRSATPSTRSQSPSVGLADNMSAYEIEQAICYVSKIKQRFHSKPEIYKEFLSILHEFQTLSRNLDNAAGTNEPAGGPSVEEEMVADDDLKNELDEADPSRSAKPSESDSKVHERMVEEVKRKVADLFKDAPDLLNEFCQFMTHSSEQFDNTQLSIFTSLGRQSTRGLQSLIDSAKPKTRTRRAKATRGKAGDGAGPATTSRKPAAPAATKRKQPATASTDNESTKPKAKRTAASAGKKPSATVKAGKKTKPPKGRGKKSADVAEDDGKDDDDDDEETNETGPRPTTSLRNGQRSFRQQRPDVCRDVELDDAERSINVNDYALFDRIKRTVRYNADVYQNFLKCLHLYNHGLLSRIELSRLVSPFLGKAPDVYAGFNALLSLNANGVYEAQSALVVSRERVMPTSDLAMEIDYASCKRYGASYVKLPDDYKSPKCSGRTALCRQVLNETWVSFPIYSEDTGAFGAGGSFAANRKTQYEELLFKVEEERFELDAVMDLNRDILKLLTSASRRLERMTQDEASKMRLDAALGGRSAVLARRAIERVYGDRANEVLDGLRRNPRVSVPVVLKRLQQKQAEWQGAKAKFNIIWREQMDKFYLKSLDHQSTNFKQSDARAIRSKALVGEIEAVYDERVESLLEQTSLSSLTSTSDLLEASSPLCRASVEPHLELRYTDWDVLIDAFQLIVFCMGSPGSAINRRDRRAVRNWLGRDLPIALGIVHCDDSSWFDELIFADSNVADGKTEGDGDSVKSEVKAELTEAPPDSVHAGGGAASDSASASAEDNVEAEPLRRVTRSSRSAQNVSCASTKAPTAIDSAGPVEAAPETAGTDEDKAPTPVTVTDGAAAAVRQRLQPVDKTLLFADEHIYCFLRLHHLLYYRLEKIKRFADVLTANERALVAKESGRSAGGDGDSQYAAIADVLQLRRPRKLHEAGFYAHFLNSLRDLIQGDTDQSSYEDELRELFGIQIYCSFTMEKLVRACLRHAQVIALDERTSANSSSCASAAAGAAANSGGQQTGLAELFYRWAEKRPAGLGATLPVSTALDQWELAYFRDADNIIREPLCFKSPRESPADCLPRTVSIHLIKMDRNAASHKTDQRRSDDEDDDDDDDDDDEDDDDDDEEDEDEEEDDDDDEAVEDDEDDNQQTVADSVDDGQEAAEPADQEPGQLDLDDRASDHPTSDKRTSDERTSTVSPPVSGQLVFLWRNIRANPLWRTNALHGGCAQLKLKGAADGKSCQTDLGRQVFHLDDNNDANCCWLTVLQTRRTQAARGRRRELPKSRRNAAAGRRKLSKNSQVPVKLGIGERGLKLHMLKRHALFSLSQPTAAAGQDEPRGRDERQHRVVCLGRFNQLDEWTKRWLRDNVSIDERDDFEQWLKVGPRLASAKSEVGRTESSANDNKSDMAYFSEERFVPESDTNPPYHEWRYFVTDFARAQPLAKARLK